MPERSSWNFLSSFILTTISDVTKRGGSEGWIRDNLNTSHLDYFYGFYAVLSVINLLVYLLIARYYVYNIDVIESEIKLRKANKEVHPSKEAELGEQDG